MCYKRLKSLYNAKIIQNMAKNDVNSDNSSTLGQFFMKHMKQHENLILQFVTDTDESDTHGELLQRSIRTAITLRKKNGIKPGDIIGLCTRDHKNSCVPIIAAQLLGAINSNFDFNLTHVGMINLLRLIAPKVMFIEDVALHTMEDCLAKAGIKVEIVVFGQSSKYCTFELYDQPHVEEKSFKADETRTSKDTAMILFSSGTTGEPKGICLNHYSFIKQFGMSDLFGTVKGSEQSVYLFSSHLYWISAVGALITCIAIGGAKVISKKCIAKNVWKHIEKYKVNNVFLIPYLAAEFADSCPKNVDISSLKTFSTGASLVTKKLMENLKRVLPGVFVFQGYGQTESGGKITVFNKNNSEEIRLQNEHPDSCGIIWNEYQWKVVDTNTEEVLGPNKRGELWVKSDFLMNGYYKMDSSSSFDSDGYLKTGDIVYYDENNYLYIVDRIKEMFKYRGVHIMPLELEKILLEHPLVKEAVVIGIPHEKDEHHPMGIVILKNKNDVVTAEDIEKFVNERVYDSQKLRAGVKIVEELPKTPSGKYARRLIKENLIKKF